MTRTPVLVLGASGYVGGELLRLLELHPRLKLAGAVSRSQAGRPVAGLFGHLAGLEVGEARFLTIEHALANVAGEPEVALVSALPHGEGALFAEVLAALEDGGRRVHAVDLSADFRLGTPAAWEAVYGRAHPAPALCERFRCGLSELEPEPPPDLIAHPGCFTTCVTLGAAAFIASGLVEPVVQAACVTGSTGSGRQPGPATHHPDRHGNLRAYGALDHRHRPEMEMLLGRLGGTRGAPRVLFVPHSGPFARGIHATLFLRLRAPLGAREVDELLRTYHARHPLVAVSPAPPALKDVVATQRALLHAVVREQDVVVHAVIDNLTRGAAGGAVQWLNRRLGIDETTGLRLGAPGWN